MSNILFANNASTVLAAPISSGATSITLATGTGSLFPSPSGAQYFLMTFVDAGTGLLTEIVKVTARSGDSCTIVRAQEGTSAQAWLAGDIAANFWTAGSVTALQAGFPISSGSISSNTTLTGTNSGTLYRVSGTSTVVSLPAASANSGMVVGFSCQALGGCQIASLGGVFAGGAVNGNTSVNLAATEFLCVQSNGTIWVIFAASPEILVGGVIALESWVTANFDPLGAAAAALATAEAYALALAGNLKGTQSVTASTNFTGNDFGWCLRLTAAASGNSNFFIDVPTVGSMIWVENNSPSFNITLRTDGTNRFFGYVGAGPYQGSTQATVVMPPQSVLLLIAISNNLWLVAYNSLSFDAAGAAANALTTAEAYADALQGNQKGLLPQTGNHTFTTDDFGYIISLQGAVSGNSIFSIPIPTPGAVFWVENNSTFTLTVQVDGTTGYFHGLVNGPWSNTNVPTVIVPPNSAIMVYGHNVSWVVIYVSLRRVVLTRNLAVFVNGSTGNDNNNGLTSGTPFATMQKAWNYVVNNYDLNGFTARITQAGTNTDTLTANGFLVGATATQSMQITVNGTWSVTNGSCLFANGTSFLVNGTGTMSATGTGIGQGVAIAVFAGCEIFWQDITFGACAVAHVTVSQSAYAGSSGNYTVAGSAPIHAAANFGACLGLPNNITFSGSIAFGTTGIQGFLSMSDCSSANVNLLTFSGSVPTGRRYYAANNASINTGGGGATFLPGNAAGTLVNGGVYS